MGSPTKTIIFLAMICVIAAPFAEAVTVDTSIFQAGTAASMDIVGYIKSLYNAGLAIGGIFAVGMIVIGAIFRITSAGSPDKIREGNEMIVSALWGVALLFGSYLILNTVNPQIVTLQIAGGSQTNIRPVTACSDLPKNTTPMKWNGKTGNCLDACGPGVTACGPTESPPNCVVCAYATPEHCSDTASHYSSPTPCTTGSGIKTSFAGSGDKDITTPLCSPDCASGIKRFDHVTISQGGTVWEAAYYPEKVGLWNASCVVYAYKKTSDEKGYTKVDLEGLKLCK
jgi:hypothetical protein